MRRNPVDQGNALNVRRPTVRFAPRTTIADGTPVSHDENRTKHPRLGLAASTALLVALAFGLLGLVIWQNREKIRKVFSRPLDLRLLALALAIYLVGMSRHLRAMVFAGPGDRAPVHAPARRSCWASSASSSTW